MPELPEVETTRRGIAPHVVGKQISAVIVRQRRLRRPIPRGLGAAMAGQTVQQVRRRGKYLLIQTTAGTLIIHLGMSGSLRLVSPSSRPGKHDHVDILFDHGRCLRLRDPRRFGLVLWTRTDPWLHPLLNALGPEPLARAFSGAYLYQRARGRRQAVKQFIMDAHTVVGVGNIYASEALFLAGIHPRRAAGRISLRRYDTLAKAIKQVLREAIAAGGTTLRDFVGGEGQAGYFRQRLSVYGRGQCPCPRCGGTIQQIRQGQRSSYYCKGCQR